MCTIEQSQLRGLIFSNRIHKHDTGGLEWRPARIEVIFDNPLSERFSHNRGAIGDSKCSACKCDLFFGGARRDSIDHRVWETRLRLDPSSKVRIYELRSRDDTGFCSLSILLNVVARQNSEGWNSALHAKP